MRIGRPRYTGIGKIQTLIWAAYRCHCGTGRDVPAAVGIGRPNYEDIDSTLEPRLATCRCLPAQKEMYLQLCTVHALIRWILSEYQNHYLVACRYLAAQNEVYLQLWASVASTALAPPINWLLIFRLGWGLDGAACSIVITHALQALLLLLMVARRDRRLSGTALQTWHGWCV